MMEREGPGREVTYFRRSKANVRNLALLEALPGLTLKQPTTGGQ